MKSPLTVPVSLSFTAPPGLQVEAVGDFPDCKYPVRMAELSPGRYGCELELEPGLYRYKFRVAGKLWFRDPLARTVDGGDVYGNNLLIVGGAAPPLFFAPDRRHVAFYEDGRVRFHLEVGEPSAAPSHVWIQDSPDDPQGRVFAPLEPYARRGTWRLLRAEARLDPSRARPDAVFGFTDAPEQVFRLPRPRAELARPPRWLDRAVLYTVFVDRWHRGSDSPAAAWAHSRRMPSTANTFYGGDLDGVREGLPYLADLGVDALVLTPLHCSPTPHRYDSTDLMTVDPGIGGEAALSRLVKAVHARKMKLVLDVAVTHVNEAHPAFQNLLARQERSRFARWFKVHRFPVVAGDGRTFHYYYDRPELPWLELGPGPARRHVLRAVERLLDLGADGLRLDAMNDAPADFWEELRARARAVNPDVLLLGEVVSDNPARFAEERGVDTATDFRHREAMLAFFGRGTIGAAEFWERVSFDEFRTGPFDPAFRLLFLDNHDSARFLSQAVLYDRLRLALAYLLLRPEPVAITYGTETGMAGSDPGHVLDDAWPERLPMPALDGAANLTQGLLKQLCRMRRTLEPLKSPRIRLAAAEGRVLVLERPGRKQTLRAYFNAGDETVPLFAVPPGAQLLLGVNDPDATVASPLPGCSARLFLVPAGRGG